MKPEQLLPEASRINVIFVEMIDIVHDEVDKIRGINGDVIDPNFELEAVDHYPQFMSGAKVLARGVYGSSDSDIDMVAYRSFMFGFQSMGMAYSDNPMVDLKYIGKYLEADDPLESYMEEVEDYLAENPSIDTFVSCYSGEIANGTHYDYVAELAVAFIIMLAERLKANQFIEGLAQSATIQDFINAEDE